MHRKEVCDYQWLGQVCKDLGGLEATYLDHEQSQCWRLTSTSQLSLGLNCSGWQKREDIEAWRGLGKRHCIITTFLAFSVWREKAATRPPLHTAPKKRSKVASKASSRVEAARSSSSKQQSNSHFFHTYCYFTSSSSLATLLQLGNSGLSALLLRCVLSTIRGRNWK